MIELMKIFKNPGRTDVFELGEQRLARLKAEGRYSCYRNTRATLRKLSLFVRGGKLLVKDVTPALMASFRNYLIEQQHNSRNTVCENLKVIARLLSEAGVEKNPCAELGLSREQSERTYLLEEEVSRIMALHLKSENEMALARDIFFAECRTGLRISDLLQLRWKNIQDGFIRIRMQKTRRKVEVPVTDSLMLVFGKYRTLFSGPDSLVFPMLERYQVSGESFSRERRLISATARVNQLIKKVAERAGISKNISTHVGRHTFATMLISKGATIYDVKELLGHHDMKVTQVYAHMIDRRKQELVKMLE